MRLDNSVGTDVSNMSVYMSRSVQAYASSGVSYSTPIVTNDTNVSGAIPLDSDIVVSNNNGIISIGAG